jgi:hypothetical protein
MLNHEQRRCKIRRAIRRIRNLKRHGAGERKEPMMPKTERSGFTIKQGIRSAAVLKPGLPVTIAAGGVPRTGPHDARGGEPSGDQSWRRVALRIVHLGWASADWSELRQLNTETDRSVP